MKISVLAGPGMSTNILLNWLEDQGYSNVEAIIESKVSRGKMLRYRLHRLGFLETVGQIAFIVAVMPFLRRNAVERQGKILEQYGLRSEVNHSTPIIAVPQVNHPVVEGLLRKREPDVVLVNGTRIIGKNTLDAVKVPFINTHAGITPNYRGVHGGYWALRCNDPANFGVTLHLVDRGVDTGSVLAHERVTPDTKDNFASFPVLQQAASFGALQRVLTELSRGHLPKTLEVDSVFSRQWFHPTIWTYLVGRIKGIR
ncbi:formyl transferase [Pseudophaeobacter sp. TrK17]|uniref:formyl transferase n=1 Tax=Pseudophaeobacter sp. TrK17 TaxID=2815167 RepID=UPI0035D0F7EE